MTELSRYAVGARAMLVARDAALLAAQALRLAPCQVARADARADTCALTRLARVDAVEIRRRPLGRRARSFDPRRLRLAAALARLAAPVATLPAIAFLRLHRAAGHRRRERDWNDELPHVRLLRPAAQPHAART